MESSGNSLKFVTVNFKTNTALALNKESFMEWKRSMESTRVEYDKRNNVYCANPTENFEMYYNYLQYINSQSNRWTGYGYFDMGLVPYIMMPSFMKRTEIVEQLRSIAVVDNIDLVPINRNVSLLNKDTVGNQEYWIFRDDLLKLSKQIEERFKKTSTPIKYGWDNPDQVTMSGFVKKFMEVEQMMISK